MLQQIYHSHIVCCIYIDVLTLRSFALIRAVVLKLWSVYHWWYFFRWYSCSSDPFHFIPNSDITLSKFILDCIKPWLNPDFIFIWAWQDFQGQTFHEMVHVVKAWWVGTQKVICISKELNSSPAFLMPEGKISFNFIIDFSKNINMWQLMNTDIEDSSKIL